MRILLVEDDEVLSDLLNQALTSQTYAVDGVDNGQFALDYALSATYDLLIIDVGLPGMDGISLCQQLRSDGCTVPILLITAKDATAERIRGLDAGADDYLIKPIDVGELQARVRALLRRGDVAPNPVLELDGLRLDPVACEVAFENRPLALTPKEYSLLELFMRNPSRVYSRGQIIEHLWTFDDPPLEDSVKAHIKGLRQKLKKVGAADWIENIYGLGYRLSPQGQFSSTAASPSGEPVAMAAPSVERQFNQAMDSLWQQHLGSMQERLGLIEQATVAAIAQTLTAPMQQQAAQAAHKLAGVLGMFGKDEGTHLARQIEQMFVETQAELNSQELRSQVQQLAQQMQLPLLQLAGHPEMNAEIASPLQAIGHEPIPLPTSTPDARLLLVDPDLELGDGLQHLAQAAGQLWYQVTQWADAQTWLKTHQPDLVVVDATQTDRSVLLPWVAELSHRTPAIPVLVLTRHDELADRVAIAQAGAQGALVKPVTPDQIWGVAAQLLQKGRSLSLNLLVVDDDTVFLDALRPMLEPWGITMTALSDPMQFWQGLQTTVPDLLILDVEMPGLNGIELCQAVRTDPNWQSLPILFLTSRRDRDTVQQIFAAGADDYISKPVLGPELLTRIMNRMERHRLLQTLIHKDPVTGLANQPQSSRELEALIHACQGHQPMSLIVLTLPDLSEVNHRYGHTVGNRVLQQWASVLRSQFRSGESLGYWGNSEFVIGMVGLVQEQVGDRLDPVLQTLRRQIFTASDGTRFQVSNRVGMAHYPQQGATLVALYQAAVSSVS